MKKLIGGAAVAAAIALIGFVAAGPFLVMHQIKSAIEQHDSEALSSHVDFPALRANLKDQINLAFMKNAASQLKGNPFAALAMALVPKVVDATVDSFVTPTSLASLMTGSSPRRTENGAAVEQQGSERPASPFRNARYSYDSTSKFSAWVARDKGDNLRVVFTREGFSWKLSNIVIPPTLFDDDKGAAKTSSRNAREDGGPTPVAEPAEQVYKPASGAPSTDPKHCIDMKTGEHVVCD